jgi:glutathione synthetase
MLSPISRPLLLLVLGCLPAAAALFSSPSGPSPNPSSLSPPPLDYLAESFPPPPVAAASSALLPPAQVDAIVEDAVAWSAAHGLLVHNPISETPAEVAATSAAPALVHAPFSLLPTVFPADQLELAQRLAPLFGLLVDRVSRDVPWLASTLHDTAAADDFTRRLLKLCTQVQREGATQEARLAILRSDYMLHEPEGCASGRLLQIELNTIASSFGALSARVGQLHTALAQRWPSVRRHVWTEAGEPKRLSLPSALPPSGAIEELAAALAAAHELYGAAQSSDSASTDPVLLLVVQPGETNRIDQDLLSVRLWEAHGVRVVRRTLAHIAHEARLVGKERRLVLSNGEEASVVYFRCGYTPDDYPSTQHWEARTVLERSHAIKCPCIEQHLVGCKKVQQQLANPGELERFLSPDEAIAVRQVFAGLWSLSGAEAPPAEAPAAEHEAAHHMRLARERPSEYVMKPQREGGGYNFFGEELVNALSTLSREQRSAYILMQRILPRRAPAVLVRGGVARAGAAVSELGVYSTLLTSKGGAVVRNRQAGHLVRTKLDGVDEGGVAAGFAVLSSPLAAQRKR